MRIVLLFVLLFAVAYSFSFTADVCPHDVEVACVNEVNKAYQTCDAAAKEKGKDTPADLDCIKYFAGLKKDCVPCICQIANFEGWKVKGCTA